MDDASLEGKSPHLAEYSSPQSPLRAARRGEPGGSDFAPSRLVGSSANGKVAGIVTVSDLLELLARKPEHKSNREVRKARGEEEWCESEA